MIKIKNKSITVKVNGKLGITPIEKKYSDLIVEAINVPPNENGFTVTEMKSRLSLIDKMEKANGEIDLTPEEFLKVKECVKRMSWRILSQDIVDFVEAIENPK